MWVVNSCPKSLRQQFISHTTGAGDVFAAGRLAGLAKGCDLGVSLRMGSIAAGRIIGVMGPRLPEGEDLAGLIAARLSEPL